VPKEWADKYKGKFDQGWDKLREETFARQKAMGVIPADCQLTARHKEIPAWDEMPEDLKPVLRRQMEVYVGIPGVHGPSCRPLDRQPGAAGQRVLRSRESVQIAIADAAENSDHLISPAEAVRIAMARQ
jgi:hypothetical protein